MKSKLTTIVFIFSVFWGFSQVLQDNVSNLEAVKGLGDRSIAGGFSYKNPPRKVEGTVYLYDRWDNYTVIEVKNGKKFSVTNANINIQRNTLESQINHDSTFVFNTANISKVIINNVPYKIVYSDEGKRIYEVIYESDDFSLLKGFQVTFIEGSPNPMVNRPTDRYARTTSFYLKENNQITPFKLRKSKLLKLLEQDPKSAKAFKEFMEANNLSYKNESDIKKAFKYSELRK